MERQRSFTFKPTRFLLFSFIISSSVIFLTFFSIWIIKTSPSTPSNLAQFDQSSVSVSITPLTFQTLNGFSKDFSARSAEKSILVDSHPKRPENISGFAGISNLSGLRRMENGSEGSEEVGKSDFVPGNFTVVQPSLNETSPEKREGVEQVVEISSEKIEISESGKTEKKVVEACDLNKGRWVNDESYPLYTRDSCPFIDEGFDCEGNGRLDKHYMKWRWQPQHCDIHRFNATKMLELIRGKRLVFVGDSINRNQWESMLCMLMGAIKNPKKVYETRGRRITKEKGNYSFKFVDYKCTVEYYVSHFLVHESKARVGQKRVQTLRIDAIDHGSSRWRGADILIFNTAHWWSHSKTKAGINYYQEGNQVHPRLDVATAFRIALMTWSSWVDKHINPRKTRVFFRSSAPSHFRGGQWNSGGHCKEATQPLNISSSFEYPEKNIIAEDVIKQMRTPITVLNITGLSDYRIDGHPSIYAANSGKRKSSRVQDCSHWCLPGVPDTWNQLFYFHLKDKERVD